MLRSRGVPHRMADPRSAQARWTLWAIVFVDLVGFGILSPLAPFYVLRTGLGAEHVTLIIASYSLAQFLAMPLWGHVSDRRGRRPVLLISMAGHALSYVILAFAGDWQTLLLARVLGGVTSANLVTAYAYSTDVTEPQDRAKALGQISGAFGLGFVFGPAIGGLLAGTGDATQADLVTPALAAAGLSVLSFLGIVFFLPESRPPGAANADGAPRPSFIEGLKRVTARPSIMALVSLCIVVVTFVSAREAIIAIWAHDKLAMTPRDIGLVLAVSGATIAAIQFFAMGELTRRFGSIRLVMAALAFFAMGWTGLILAQSWAHVAAATVLTATATALFQTQVQTLVSQTAEPEERGMVLGVYQSSNSLARFGGQALSGSAYTFLGRDAPFAMGALMMAPAMILLFWIARRMGAQAAPVQTPAE